MNAETACLLQEAGVDLADAHSRFSGDETLFLTLVALYLDDTHFDELARAIERNDAQSAFKSAHALKGAAGNLSLARLHEAACTTCELLRTGDIERARKSMPALNAAHAAARSALSKLSPEPR